jgi:dTDP-4-dehydrorhamnose reductase
MNAALVIGADGLVGSALTAALKARGRRVIGTTRRCESASTKDTVHLDLADPIPAALPEMKVVYICAAMTKLADCRLSPDLARRINYEAPLDIATRFVRQGTKVVFLSTAAVLDCRAPRMRADRPREGQSVYGKWKGAAEAGILALSAQATVLRLTKVLTPDAILFRNWVRALRSGETIEAFDDHRISPIRLCDVVGALLAIGDAPGGIFQVSGAHDVSFFDMARHLAKAFDAPADSVVECHASAHGIPPEETSSFTSLDCGRLTDLNGFKPPEPYRILDELFIRTLQTCPRPELRKDVSLREGRRR